MAVLRGDVYSVRVNYLEGIVQHQSNPSVLIHNSKAPNKAVCMPGRSPTYICAPPSVVDMHLLLLLKSIAIVVIAAEVGMLFFNTHLRLCWQPFRRLR